MKKMISIVVLGLFLASCTSMQNFSPNDVTAEGIRYKYGTDKGVNVGDTINVYKRSRRGMGIGFLQEPVGKLTVIKVEKDYSVLKKVSEFELNENTSLVK